MSRRDDEAPGGLGHLRSLAISHPQAMFLRFVAERAGEISWDWARVDRPDVRAMVTDLINKRILAEREYVTHAAQAQGQNYLRLTDQGRAIVDRLETLHRQATATAATASAASADVPAPPGGAS